MDTRSTVYGFNWIRSISQYACQSSNRHTPRWKIEKYSPKKKKTRFTYFQMALLASVLEDAIMKLYLLSKCNTEIRIQKAHLEMMKLLADKYGVEKKEVSDMLDDYNLKDLDCPANKLKKLEEDRLAVIHTLIRFYVDMVNKPNFPQSVQLSFENDHVPQRLEKLIESEAQHSSVIRELKRQRRHLHNQIKSAAYEANNRIENLKAQIQDFMENTNIRSRYVDSWQLARTEQNIQAITNKEAKPINNINHYKERTEIEQRVHNEIELLNTIIINEKLTQVEEWINKYERDVEKIDLKIQIKRQNYEEMCVKRKKLEETLQKHDISMNNWLTFKDEREKARLYRETMHKAAITVQAWWRGLLVRQQLGPYKVVKKTKTAEKEGKKKK